MSLTVDDILGARPSLRDRARQALAAKEAAEQLAYLDTRAELIAEAERFMIEELDVLAGDLPVDYINDHVTAGVQGVRWRLDGITFRLHFKQVKVFGGASDNKEFATETVYDNIPVVHVQVKTAWSFIASLADLGKALC